MRRLKDFGPRDEGTVAVMAALSLSILLGLAALSVTWDRCF